MPQKCPVCWLNQRDTDALLVALACGETYYSIAQRFHLPPMAAWRHQRNCMFGEISRLREFSTAKGPRAARRRIVREFPHLAAAVDAWLAGERRIRALPPARDELPKLRRRHLALQPTTQGGLN